MKDVDGLYKKMVDTAGQDLTSRIMNIFEGHVDLAVYWVYTTKFSLNNKSPDRYCQEGKISEVEKVVDSLERGVLPEKIIL
jgi:hypothetical protein